MPKPERSPRVVVLGLRGFPGVQGGVEKHCEHLTVELARQGCDVTVLTRRPYVRPELTRYRGVRLQTLPALRQRSLEAFLHTLLGVLAARRLHPDVLHLQAIGPALWTPLARLLGLRVVVTHHGPDYEREKWGILAKAVLRLGERLGVTFAQQVIAIAPNIAARLEERFHRRATVIPNGVVLPRLRPTTAVLRKFRLAPKRYFLAVGRFVPEKNFCDLIQAFGRLASGPGRRLAGWKLAIAGRADHASDYGRRLVELAAATPGVVLTGFVSGRPLEELYSHAGLFVLPSSYEGLPLVLLEALSYGLSCVVSDIPANRAVRVGLENGRFFPPGNVAELARRLALWAKPATARQRREWRNQLAENYNWRKIATQTLGVYRSLVP